MTTPDPTPASAVPDLTAAEFAAWCAGEVAGLENDVRPTYARYAVAPVRMSHRWTYRGRTVAAPVWVVARAGEAVLGYDETEEEFGIGVVPAEGLVPGGEVADWGTFGARLRWTLLRFPDPAAYAKLHAG